MPRWLPIILIILSNDINLNPGPHFQNKFFNFMSWNVNSLAKDNFHLLLLTIPLLNFKISCQTLNIYIQKSKLKILLQYFLQVILMHTPSFGGLMATQLQKVQKLKNFSRDLVYPNLSQNQRIMNLTKPLIYWSNCNWSTKYHSRQWNSSFFHHRIVHCKVNFRIPPPLPFDRKIWHFNRANSATIKRSMTSFPWRQYLNINTDPNWQVKTFTYTFLNIMSNIIPNETKRFVPRNPPGITKPLKTTLNKKNRLLNNYKRHGYKAEDKVILDAFRIECQQALETGKLSYLTNLANKINNPGTSQKSP